MRTSIVFVAVCATALATACRSARALPPPAVGHPACAETTEASAPELRGPASGVLAAPAVERNPESKMAEPMQPERLR